MGRTQWHSVSLCLDMYVWEAQFQCSTFWTTCGVGQSSYYSINGGKVDLINQLPARASPFLSMTEATSMVWATKAFHGTTAQSVVRFATQDATVTFKQALTCRKISVILNGGLRQEGHTTQVRDTTSSGTREASSTKSRRRPVGESRHSWSSKSHTGRLHIPASLWLQPTDY